MIVMTKYIPGDSDELSRQDNTRLNRAIRLARVSEMRQKHGAALWVGGRLIAVGVNILRNQPTVNSELPYDGISYHAEVNVLRQLSAKTTGGKLYVARISAGKNIADSMPCDACQRLIETFRIDSVFYTIWP